MTLVEALGLERARLVSICGAGGKTSLMFALAQEYVAAGERVLITTTTKIARDEATGPWPAFTVADADEIVDRARAAWRRDGDGGGRAGGGAVIAVAGDSGDGTRLIGFAPEAIGGLKTDPCFDRIVVEADGSQRKPLKAPAAHEPVVPTATDAFVRVAGLDGLGKPLGEETLFRAEIWARLTGLALGAPISAESLVRAIVHQDGLAKGCPDGARRCLFLNRCDTPGRRAQARRIVALLADAPGRRPDCAVSGRLLPTPEIAAIVSFPSPSAKE